MPVKSQQRVQSDKARVHTRANTHTAETLKSTPTTMKRDVNASRVNSSKTGTKTGLPMPAESKVNDPRVPAPLKIIAEVDETNIEEILHLPDVSQLPTAFLTEIRENKVYETIYKEIQKKLPSAHGVDTPPTLTLPKQRQRRSSSLSSQPFAISVDDSSLGDAASVADDSPGRSDDRASPSQDGYDTDIESDVVIPASQDVTGRMQYLALCSQSKSVPCSYFMAHIQDKEMVLRHHQFNTDDFQTIAKSMSSNTHIERLFLDGNYLQRQAAIYISDMLISNDFITELSLADNRLGGGGGEGTAEICRMLTVNRNLKKINLSGNKFNDLDTTLLVEAFEHNRALRDVNLSHNCFGEECGKLFGAYISGNESLEAIDLSWNNIRGHSAIDIAHGIKENVRLKRCNLEMNGYGPDSGKELADCIQQNAALEELNISSNRLNTKNAFAIAQALLSNDSLRVLRIGNNQINSDGVLAIFLCVKTNESNILREVDFSHTVVTEEVLKTCEDIVQLKEGKFQYRTGKVTPQILQSNARSECYTRTDDDVLNKLRAKAANAKTHFA